MAVHLDIRPRLTFPAEPRAQAPGRRRWRLPPLALPAVGYWLAMAALTYGFTRLGPNPLDDAPAPAAHLAPQLAPVAEPASDSHPVAAPPAPAAEPAPSIAEAPPSEEPEASAPLAAVEREPRVNDDANNARAPRDFGADHHDEKQLQLERNEPQRQAISFPEFTDSSRPKPRERAADGPRIDSLFERAAERPSSDAAPDPVPPPESAPAPSVVTSCEAAIARNNEQLTIGGARGPADITREAYASILQNGRYLATCTIPDRTVFEICAAVKDGRAIGITIVSNPASPDLNACVRNAVARLKFPQNSRLDVTHTRFDAVKR